MKYPKAGDLQRATATQIASNPAQRNPYEVHSASGLEGVFADQDDAEFHAGELRREGVQNVTVAHRRRPSYADRAIAARSLREEEQAVHDYGERIEQAESPELREALKHAREEEMQHAAMLRPLTRNPAPEWQVSRSITNMQDGIRFQGGAFGATRYFKHIGVDVNGVGYGWLERCYGDLDDAEKSTCLVELTDGRVEAFPASQVWPVAGRYPERPIVLARRAARGNPGPRVLREPWGDASDIVIERHRHGISGWLESKRGGGRLPISFGAAHPETLREAMDLAKKFLRAAHGRTNPAGLTAKGERMYEDIKRGYEERGEPRAKEIASRTVLARAKEIPGLKKRRR